MKMVEQAIFTENVDEMAVFYETLLGQSPIARSEGMAIFMQGDVKIFIHSVYEQKEGDLPPENHTAFEVEIVDATCEQLSAAGITLEVLPADYYWGRSAYLRDPAGRLIELIEVSK